MVCVVMWVGDLCIGVFSQSYIAKFVLFIYS